MISARIQRLPSTPEGTCGYLIVTIGEDMVFQCRTIELPWYDNQQNISCIAAGRYECYWRWSQKFNCYRYGLKNVPNRSGILIHPGNMAGDKAKGHRTNVKGCIALGSRMGVLWNQMAVMDSRTTCAAFEIFAQHKRFWLEVIGP